MNVAYGRYYKAAFHSVCVCVAMCVCICCRSEQKSAAITTKTTPTTTAKNGIDKIIALKVVFLSIQR